MSCKYYIWDDFYDHYTCALRDIDNRYYDDDTIECYSDQAWDYRLCSLLSWAERIGYNESQKCQKLEGFDGKWSVYSGRCTDWKCYCSIHEKHVDPHREGCFGSFSRKCPSYQSPKSYTTSGVDGCCGSSDIDDTCCCFISTACVTARGLPDDCDELQTLRKYRDLLIKERVGFAEIVEEYYQHAPLIVERIEHEPNKSEIYEKLYSNLVLRCVSLLNEGKIDSAVQTYIEIYESLKQQYLV